MNGNQIWYCLDLRREEHHFIASSAEEADSLYRQAFGAVPDPDRSWTALPENRFFIFYPEPTEAPHRTDCGPILELLGKYTKGYLTRKLWLAPSSDFLACARS